MHLTDFIGLYCIYAIASTCLSIEEYDFPDPTKNWIAFTVYLVLLIGIMSPLVYFPIKMARVLPGIFVRFVRSLYRNVIGFRPKFLYEPFRESFKALFEKKNKDNTEEFQL